MSVFYYSAFGERLASAIELPDLRSTEPGHPRWRFELAESLPEMDAPELLGEDRLYASISARLYRHSHGYRIVIGDTGSYDLLEDGTLIRWEPTEDPWWDFGRNHLLGRVLATSLQLSGIVTLHGSAVEMADGVVGFLAPKKFGKSTLAMQLFRGGARFVTDDSLPIDPGSPALAYPGIQSLRVRAGDPDNEALVGAPIPEAAGRDGKVVLPPFPAEHVLERPRPLSALYLLQPVAPGSTQSVLRRRVPDMLAAIRLVGQTKIGSMLGPSFGAALLEAAAAIASSTPVYELQVARDLQRLPEVVGQLVAWHGVRALAPVEVP